MKLSLEITTSEEEMLMSNGLASAESINTRAMRKGVQTITTTSGSSDCAMKLS